MTYSRIFGIFVAAPHLIACGTSGDLAVDCRDHRCAVAACDIKEASCAPGTCGDGVRGGDEECDGLDFDGKGCSAFGLTHGALECDANCKVLSGGCWTCGNGHLEALEPCDPGGPGTGNVEAVFHADVASCSALGMIGDVPQCRADCTLDVSTCTGCGDGVKNGAEQCDGLDFGDAACATLGFVGGPVACTQSCEIDTSACSLCGNGVADAGEPCDGLDLAGATCANGGFAAGHPTCTEQCALAFVGCNTCGDGQRTGGEACDGTDFGGARCTDLGFARGELACAGDCALDVSGCTHCGDGVRGAGESCDGADLGWATCTSLGYAGGSLSCIATCHLDTTACECAGTCVHQCGNGIREPGEECDGSDFGTDWVTCFEKGFDSGQITTCTSDCMVSTSSCGECGDGAKNGAEECDGGDFGGATCVSLGLPEPSSGVLSCTVSCRIDGTACGGCGTSRCGDCFPPSACVRGLCQHCEATTDCCASQCESVPDPNGGMVGECHTW